MRREEAIASGERALDLAERLDDAEIAVHALGTIGRCQEDYEKLEQCLERARHAGLAEQVGRTFVLLADGAVEGRRHTRALWKRQAGDSAAAWSHFPLGR